MIKVLRTKLDELNEAIKQRDEQPTNYPAYYAYADEVECLRKSLGYTLVLALEREEIDIVEKIKRPIK